MWTSKQKVNHTVAIAMFKQLASEISFFRIEEHWMLWLRGGAGGQGGSRFTLWSICSLMSIAWTPNHLNVNFMRVEFPNDTSNLIVFKRFFIIKASIRPIRKHFFWHKRPCESLGGNVLRTAPPYESLGGSILWTAPPTIHSQEVAEL